MSHSRGERENTWHIEMAARQGKPFAAIGGIESDHLYVPAVRQAPEPEPVTWRDLNGRDPAEWEEALIVAARERERAREWRP